MSAVIRWGLIGLVVVIVGVVPVVFYRMVYNHSKRLREVDPGRFYRSGQMTSAGFTEAVQRFGIRTIINVQDDYPDPDVRTSFWSSETIKESAMCRQFGVRFVTIEPDLVSRYSVPEERPHAIETFLQLLDDESNYPVLLHCKAGLHRTGVLTAVYRMERQGWSRRKAFQELRANGFGDRYCTIANDYVKQYVLTYEPGQRRNTSAAGLKTE